MNTAVNGSVGIEHKHEVNMTAPRHVRGRWIQSGKGKIEYLEERRGWLLNK
jgi:hypothetical protein